MQYINVEKYVVEASEPRWSLSHRSNVIDVKICRNGFFFDVSYLYKNLYQAQVAARALQSGKMKMPVPDQVVSLHFDRLLGKVR